MDASGLYDDEVVADSEEEDNSLEVQFNGIIPNVQTESLVVPSKPQPITPNPTTISPYVTIPRTDSQSSNTAKPTPLSDPATKPRPRPRPAYKKAVANIGDSSSSIAIASTDPILPPQSAFTSDIHMDFPSGTSNIADRAKMRSRKSKDTVPSAASSSTTGKHERNAGAFRDIIELTSDEEDDLALPPISKPMQKPKPKPKNKAIAKAKSNGSPLDAQPKSRSKRSKTSHPGSSNMHATQDTLPVPTSSIHPNDFPIPFKLLPSQLPPSDPPTSTAATYDLPPIATLPNRYADMDILSSSPSSLFSVAGSSGKKRKRAQQRVDELDSDKDQDSRMDVDARMMPPEPPNFFAGSSSSYIDAPAQVLPVEVVDSSIIPSTADPSAPVKKAPKPRRKKGNYSKDGEPSEVGKLAPKKVKATRKKLEVVIDGRAKNRGKENEKEVFKSKEFIDDEDADNIPSIIIRSSTKPDSLTSLSSVPDSEDEKQEGPSKRRRTAVEHQDEEATKAKGKAKESSPEHDEPDIRPKVSKKGKGKRVIVSDDEDEAEAIAVPTRKKGSTRVSVANKGKERARAHVLDSTHDDGDLVEVIGDDHVIVDEEEGREVIKENVQPVALPSYPKPAATPAPSLFPSLSSRYTIAPRTKSTPMSELIRRVNSLPGSPFSTPRLRATSSSQLKPSTPGTAYSPYLKSSKSLLSRIAPLHPNRRTPPPPLPPPPPPKKTKKELEREEQWEEELIESVGGITEWACMTDVERKELRKVKWAREMSGWED